MEGDKTPKITPQCHGNCAHNSAIFLSPPHVGMRTGSTNQAMFVPLLVAGNCATALPIEMIMAVMMMSLAAGIIYIMDICSSLSGRFVVLGGSS